MDYKQYTFVGWIAIINAIATIPILVFNIALEQLLDTGQVLIRF